MKRIRRAGMLALALALVGLVWTFSPSSAASPVIAGVVISGFAIIVGSAHPMTDDNSTGQSEYRTQNWSPGESFVRQAKLFLVAETRKVRGLLHRVHCVAQFSGGSTGVTLA